MHRVKISGLLLIVTIFACPSVALAWGAIGHRVVGQIADAHPKTGKQKTVPTKVTLGSGYDAASKPIVEDQLAKGGQRLAAILNNLYK